jgi:hypothetical protein
MPLLTYSLVCLFNLQSAGFTFEDHAEPLVCLFSPAWDAIILTQDIGFICPFVVIDPTD